jgi:hypothetical protein
MNTVKNIIAFVALVGAATGCDAFRDPTPRNVSFRMSGSDGNVVAVIYSTAFTAGVDEFGVTRVEVFVSDTVMHTLPIDTIISIVLERRLFLQVMPAPTDTLSVAVRIDVDGRVQVDTSGRIFPESPWRYVYQYNTPFTDDIELII